MQGLGKVAGVFQLVLLELEPGLKPEPELLAAKALRGGAPDSVLGDQGCDHLWEGIVAAVSRRDQLHHLSVDVLPAEARLQQHRHLCLL